MGGTDRMDKNLSQYRCSIRSKKWRWSLFIFGRKAALENAWLIYGLCPAFNKKKIDLLEFRKDVCLTHFTNYSNKRKIGRPLRKAKKFSRVPEAIRIDKKIIILLFTENN